MHVRMSVPGAGTSDAGGSWASAPRAHAPRPLPPGPRRLGELVRYNLVFLRNPHEALARLFAEYGPIARVQLGHLPIVLMVGPEANRLIFCLGIHFAQIEACVVLHTLLLAR